MLLYRATNPDFSKEKKMFIVNIFPAISSFLHLNYNFLYVMLRFSYI